ncbi:shikimate dehydrogenase [Nocardioides sp. Leaf374]|uniref:shikimate dehydrogenase n=1 Tax=Nocardioides sp. Leaf374 TaxID=2876560 RepID=UPI001E43AE23|nr:shikimate dehydrogenase [Nocardioides sp. Leaf374]
MRCAVVGDPVGHSLSPVLHRAAYAALGLDWTYEAVRVASGTLPEVLAGLDDSWRGLSLTMPLKREVMALAVGARGEVTERARLVGAANTLLVDEPRLRADNTDLPGAVAAVRERWDGEVTRAVVLGGGATAASTGLAACELGAREVVVLARTPERATETVDAIRRHPGGAHVRVLPLATPAEEVGPAELVVSTVPAAAQTPDLVLRWARTPVVFEVVYDPWPTPLAAAAATADGTVLVAGLDLLVHQAALQVEFMTGRLGPVDVMRAAGAAALAARAPA